MLFWVQIISKMNKFCYILSDKNVSQKCPCKDFPLSIQCGKTLEIRKVLKKLKLVHIQVEKIKVGTSCT